jgi:hypothetical protein
VLAHWGGWLLLLLLDRDYKKLDADRLDEFEEVDFFFPLLLLLLPRSLLLLLLPILLLYGYCYRGDSGLTC